MRQPGGSGRKMKKQLVFEGWRYAYGQWRPNREGAVQELLEMQVQSGIDAVVVVAPPERTPCSVMRSRRS